jgi:hypothetical protein
MQYAYQSVGFLVVSTLTFFRSSLGTANFFTSEAEMLAATGDLHAAVFITVLIVYYTSLGLTGVL